MIKENKDKIERVKSLLCDEKSVRLYEIFVEKVKDNLKDYTDVADDIYEHYFSDGIFRYKDNEILVNGGAFDGDDTVWFSTMLHQQGGKLIKSYCFEPDTVNFARTCHNLKKHFGTAVQSPQEGIVESDQFKVFKSGLFDKNCGMEFCEYGAYSSRVTNNESISGIPVIRLDDAVNDAVTFIKYDLEGSDIPAI